SRMVALEDMPSEQLKKYFAEPRDYISPEERRGLSEIKRLALEVLAQPADPERELSLGPMFEVATAVNNHRRPTVPEKLTISEVPVLLRRYLHNPVAQGTLSAADIAEGSGKDPSRLDPTRSDFWEPRGAISAQDLYAGYGRSALPNLTNCVW